MTSCPIICYYIGTRIRTQSCHAPIRHHVYEWNIVILLSVCRTTDLSNRGSSIHGLEYFGFATPCKRRGNVNIITAIVQLCGYLALLWLSQYYSWSPSQCAEKSFSRPKNNKITIITIVLRSTGTWQSYCIIIMLCTYLHVTWPRELIDSVADGRPCYIRSVQYTGRSEI